VPLEDLQEASEILIKALLIREKYMSASMQYFPPTTARLLRSVGESEPYAPGLYPPLEQAQNDALSDGKLTLGSLVAFYCCNSPISL
jgi:hypothetical protein